MKKSNPDHAQPEQLDPGTPSPSAQEPAEPIEAGAASPSTRVQLERADGRNPKKSTEPGLGPEPGSNPPVADLEQPQPEREFGGRLSEEQWLEALRHFDRHTLPPEVRREWMLAEAPRLPNPDRLTAPPTRGAPSPGEAGTEQKEAGGKPAAPLPNPVQSAETARVEASGPATQRMGAPVIQEGDRSGAARRPESDPGSASPVDRRSEALDRSAAPLAGQADVAEPPAAPALEPRAPEASRIEAGPAKKVVPAPGESSTGREAGAKPVASSPRPAGGAQGVGGRAEAAVPPKKPVRRSVTPEGDRPSSLRGAAGALGGASEASRGSADALGGASEVSRGSAGALGGASEVSSPPENAAAIRAETVLSRTPLGSRKEVPGVHERAVIVAEAPPSASVARAGPASRADRAPPFADTVRRPRTPRRQAPVGRPRALTLGQRLGPLAFAVLGMGATVAIFWALGEDPPKEPAPTDRKVSVSMQAASPPDSGERQQPGTEPAPSEGTGAEQARSAETGTQEPAGEQPDPLSGSGTDPDGSPNPRAASTAGEGPSGTPGRSPAQAFAPGASPLVSRSGQSGPRAVSQSSARKGAALVSSEISKSKDQQMAPCVVQTTVPCPGDRGGPRTLGGVDIETPLISE